MVVKTGRKEFGASFFTKSQASCLAFSFAPLAPHSWFHLAPTSQLYFPSRSDLISQERRPTLTSPVFNQCQVCALSRGQQCCVPPDYSLLITSLSEVGVLSGGPMVCITPSGQKGFNTAETNIVKQLFFH